MPASFHISQPSYPKVSLQPKQAPGMPLLLVGEGTLQESLHITQVTCSLWPCAAGYLPWDFPSRELQFTTPSEDSLTPSILQFRNILFCGPKVL